MRAGTTERRLGHSARREALLSGHSRPYRTPERPTVVTRTTPAPRGEPPPATAAHAGSLTAPLTRAHSHRPSPDPIPSP